ncbi:MAG: type II secretion system F family protein [Proteobacteria bacterium]|nr:type II secretion system F family protein [Pseudomonadota bacterium]MBU4448267.1 type II secretion system F family protein [Pseudomonadota bacterium]MCG2771785.1 type II secretion system F family protein [Desulfobacterales bacterium]
MELLQAVLFGLLVGGMIIFLGIFLRQRYSSVRRRLQPNPRLNTDLMRPQMAGEPVFLSAKLSETLEKKLDLTKGGQTFKKLQAKLIQAGIYTERGIPLFLGVKLGGLLVLPILVLFILWGDASQRTLMVIAFSLCILAYFLPNFLLNRVISSRQQKIREALPDALDLLVVCVEAGQGLDAAIKRVAEDMQESSPIMSQELLLVNLEIMAGLERQQALKNLGERTGVEELISLCNILIQSDRFGTSIAQALKTQSDYTRNERRQRLETLANQTPVKLLFPMLLFIFPAIMVVILGPAIIKLTEFFSKGG